MDALTGLLMGFRINGSENIKIHSFPRSQLRESDCHAVSSITNLIQGSIRLYAHHTSISNYTYWAFNEEIPQAIRTSECHFTWTSSGDSANGNYAQELYIDATEIRCDIAFTPSTTIASTKPFPHVIEII